MNLPALTAVLLTVVLLFAGLAVAGERPDDANTATHPDSPSYVIVAGADRFDTAARIAVTSYPRSHSEVLYVANGDTLVDAIAVGVTNEGPSKMLLVRADEVPDVTADALERLQVAKVVFLGGDVAISPQVRDEVLATVGWYVDHE